MTQVFDTSLPFQVADLELRTMLQYSKFSLLDFMKYLHNIPIYEMQPPILDCIDSGSREILMIFRKWGKSTSIEDLIVKELAFEDQSFVLIFGLSDDAAKERLSTVKKWFEKDKMPLLPNGKVNPFPQLKPQKKGRGGASYKWANNDFILTNNNRCKALGFMSAILGTKEADLRPTLILIDDPTDPNNPSDDAKMIKRLLQTITPLGSPKTRIIITLTPRRFTDLGMTIMRDKDTVYNIHFIPAIDENGKVTVPEFWLIRGSCCEQTNSDKFKCHDLEGEELIWMHVEQMKREVKSIGWATEYMLQPIDDGSSLFPQDTLDACKLDGVIRKDGSSKEKWTFKLSRQESLVANEYFILTGVIPERIPCVIGYDPAIGESPDGDFVSITVLSCEEGKPSKILHAERFRGVNYQGQKDRLYELYKMFRPMMLLVEKNGWQILFVNDMPKYQALMPIQGHETHNEKHATNIGIPSMKSNFENEQIEAPYGDAESIEYVDNLFHELHGMIYEEGKVKSITANDDCGISLWLAIMAAREVVDSQVVVYEGVSF